MRGDDGTREEGAQADGSPTDGLPGDDPFRRRPRPARAVPRKAGDPRKIFSWSDSHWPISISPGLNIAVPRFACLAVILTLVGAVAAIAVIAAVG